MDHIAYDQNIYPKKILCKNMITIGSCKYGTKCRFAHTLEEQYKLPIRKIIYDDIIGQLGCEYPIKIEKESTLYKELMLMGNVCDKCKNHKCMGGYNCHYGAIDKKYIICTNELMHGFCDNECERIHLIKNGKIIIYYDKYKQNIDIPIRPCTSLELIPKVLLKVETNLCDSESSRIKQESKYKIFFETLLRKERHSRIDIIDDLSDSLSGSSDSSYNDTIFEKIDRLKC